MTISDSYFHFAILASADQEKQINRKAQLLFASNIAENCIIVANDAREESAWRHEIKALRLTDRFKTTSEVASHVSQLNANRSAVICTDDRLSGLTDRLGVPFFLLPNFSDLTDLETTGQSSQKKIAIVGPESTGKTTLARQLAEHFNTLWVPEYSRILFEFLGRPCFEADVETLVVGQLAMQKTYEAFAQEALICDTEPRLSKVWANFLYGRFQPELEYLLASSHFEHYLITKPDLPWEPDPLRSEPLRGNDFFNACKKHFISIRTAQTEIEGNGEIRLKNAINALENLWN